MEPEILHKRLSERIALNSLRVLKDNSELVDFSSNDYLGFAQNIEIWEEANNLLKVNTKNINGSSGSRLLTGHRSFVSDLENSIAKFHNAEAGIFFNSGFDANTGLLGSVIQKEDIVICDSLIHASLIDGVKISKAKRYIFEHNDMKSLEEKLKKSDAPNIFIIVESVYSMDGDICRLHEICTLAHKYGAYIIVDEAHATGVIGHKGQGLVAELQLESKIFARIHTFGKAIGVHGAIVLGSKQLKDYLINFSRPLVYSTFLPFHSIFAIQLAYDNLSKSNDKILLINHKINLFKASIQLHSNLISSTTPIQSLVIPGNKNCKEVALRIQKAGFDVRAILSPTVAKGSERIRICLHTFNSDEEIKRLCDLLSNI